MSKKTCSKCGEEKDHDEFYGQAGEDPLVLRLGADYLEKAAKAS